MDRRVKKKVYVALSGGVDSSVAAYLLKKKGYDVYCVFMKNWEGCEWHDERRSAEAVALFLHVPFAVWDFTKEYKKYILGNFYSEYGEGRTPNPDVLCNNVIKFGFFLKKALQEGADLIATGHYVRKTKDGLLKKAADTSKDQSYFLWALTREQRDYALFPIGQYTKDQTRNIAGIAGLKTHDKKDSQGLCFVGEIQLRDFLKGHLTAKMGYVINENSTVIGEHNGIAYYTEGQREGLRIGGQKVPHYVAYKDVRANVIVAAPRDSELHYTKKITLRDTLLHSGSELPAHLSAKIRYRQDDQTVWAVHNDGVLELYFEKPQFAVSQGQSVVLYNGSILIGGGIIDKVERQFRMIETILNTHAS